MAISPSSDLEVIAMEFGAAHAVDAVDEIGGGLSSSGAAGQASAPLVTVVVPTLNEKENVRAVANKVGQVLGGLEWELIFVDDDSPDGTAGNVRQIGRNQARVRCVHRVGRRGLSTACIEGMLASSAPYLAVMDGDLQHDPTLLRNMIDILEAGEVEVVVGSRYVEGGSCGDWSRRRRQISRLGVSLGRLVLREDVKDPMSTFFALRRELLDEVVHDLSGLSFKILLDILASVRRPVKFLEIPFVLGHRHTGESKFDASVACEYLLLLADKGIGRYVPMAFISPALIGLISATAHLVVVSVLFGLGGLDFRTSEIFASALSMGVIYIVNKMSRRRDRNTDWRLRIGRFLSFVTVCGVGAASNVALAVYLTGRGFDWSFGAAVGLFVWVVWNCAATNFSLGVKLG